MYVCYHLEFYASVLTLGSFYPNMFISENEKIYKIRFRKLRKLRASCGSSDESSEQSIDCRDQSFETHGFLKSIRTPSSSESEITEIEDSEEFLSHKIKTEGITSWLEEQMFDIYGQCEDQINVQEIIDNQKDGPLMEQMLGSLILEFNDFDEGAHDNDKRFKVLQAIDFLDNQQDQAENESIIFKPRDGQIDKKLFIYHKKYHKERRLNGSDPFKVYRKERIEEITKLKGKNSPKNGIEQHSRPQMKRAGNKEKIINKILNDNPKSVRDKALELLEKVQKTTYV